MRYIVGKAGRIDDTAAGKGQPLLRGEERLLARLADAQRMRRPIEKARRHQPIDIGNVHRAIADTAVAGSDFHQRFQPVHAARAIAHDGDIKPQPIGMAAQRRRHLIGTARHGNGIARHVDNPAHDIAPARSASRRSGESRANTWPSSIADGAAEHRPRQ